MGHSVLRALRIRAFFQSLNDHHEFKKRPIKLYLPWELPEQIDCLTEPKETMLVCVIASEYRF